MIDLDGDATAADGRDGLSVSSIVSGRFISDRAERVERVVRRRDGEAASAAASSTAIPRPAPALHQPPAPLSLQAAVRCVPLSDSRYASRPTDALRLAKEMLCAD